MLLLNKVLHPNLRLFINFFVIYYFIDEIKLTFYFWVRNFITHLTIIAIWINNFTAVVFQTLHSIQDNHFPLGQFLLCVVLTSLSRSFKRIGPWPIISDFTTTNITVCFSWVIAPGKGQKILEANYIIVLISSKQGMKYFFHLPWVLRAELINIVSFL